VVGCVVFTQASFGLGLVGQIAVARLSAIARNTKTGDPGVTTPGIARVSSGRNGMKVTGRCHCGQISFEAEIDPAQVRICHCTDCQTLTGTAFRTNVSSLPGTFVLKSGTPKIYIKTAESGNKRAHGFCPECGTPLYSTTRGPNPTSYGLRVGALDRRAELRPTRQGWCRSALPWSMDITGVERFERQP
jgi:hypothetical protein